MTLFIERLLLSFLQLRVPAILSRKADCNIALLAFTTIREKSTMRSKVQLLSDNFVCKRCHLFKHSMFVCRMKLISSDYAKIHQEKQMLQKVFQSLCYTISHNQIDFRSTKKP